MPALDELEQNINQPYAKALHRLRPAHEALRGEFREYKERVAPWEQLASKYADPSTVEARLDLVGSLFSPVLNQQTQQPEVDAESGAPLYTTRPFIERADTQNPGLAEQMLSDLLTYETPGADGQKAPMWQQLLKTWGLDPARLADYRNIDALAAKPTGEIHPDELAQIPDHLRDAFKSLPAEVRDEMLLESDAVRNYHLEAQKERLERKAAEQSARDAATRAAQEQEQQFRVQVAQQQEAYLAQQRQEGLSQILGDLASKVTFSGDETTNTVMTGVIGSLLTSLIDPDLRFATENTLKALGVTIDPTFDAALLEAAHHGRAYKAHELAGRRWQADDARAAMNGARNQVFAKLSTVALAAARALGGQTAARAAQAGQSLSQATSLRPTPAGGAGGAGASSAGILPPGMRPDSPEANRFLWEQSQQRGQQG